MNDRTSGEGLGSKASGPDFRWPSVPAGPARANPSAVPPTRTSIPEPSIADPAVSLPDLKRRQKTRPRRAAGSVRSGRRQRSVAGRSLVLLTVLILLVMAGRIVVDLASRSSDPAPFGSTPVRPRPTPTASLAATWTLAPRTLRTDLGAPEFVSSMDGTFDDVRAIDGGRAWLVLTGDAADTGVRLHGLDPANGRELWQRPLANGLCAPELLKGSVLCAASSGVDPATGLGTSWHLMLLDPATGAERLGADFAGWLTLLHVHGNRVLLVEQRQPAPHAVLTVLDGSLKQQWQQDLAGQPQHAGMFSDNRIYNRKLPIPAGPALDRPRIRTVANGLTALWVGQTTAFIDLATPALVGMPRCSRLVDDGERLWCNQGDLATALDYRIQPLYSTALSTRLAFPDRDPRAGDVTDPVFLNAKGAAVRVDLTTGRTIGPLVSTSNGSAFGLVISPQSAFVDGISLIWDAETMFAVNARTGAVRWQRNDVPHFRGDVLDWNGRLLLAGNNVIVLDPDSGRTVAGYQQPHGLYTQALGQVLIATGSDELARLANP